MLRGNHPALLLPPLCWRLPLVVEIIPYKVSVDTRMTISVLRAIISGGDLSLQDTSGVKWVCYSIHTHTNPWGKLWSDHMQSPGWQPTLWIMYGLISDLMICKFRKVWSYNDTECPYWDKVSLNNNTTQTQPFLTRYPTKAKHMHKKQKCCSSR